MNADEHAWGMIAHVNADEHADVFKEGLWELGGWRNTGASQNAPV